VTRPSGQSEGIIAGLSALGAKALARPTISIGDPKDPEPLHRAVENLESYDWIVFTSANGVVRFWEVLGGPRADAPLPGGTRVAAIGPATAEALVDRGVYPAVVPEEYVAEAVADALVGIGELDGRRVLLPRAAGARKVLPERLMAAGAEVDEVVAYEAQPDAEGIAALRADLERRAVDMITFTAASTVRHYVEIAGPDLGAARVAVLGPITAAAARLAGVRVDAEAAEYTVRGLLRAICDYYTDLKEQQ
jgi:uroporphyrinogen III methyltransferase/synthase